MKIAVKKLYKKDQIIEISQLWKSQGKKVVFTNGCFDLLHPGHIHLLENSRKFGDELIVGLNSDKSVVSNKGSHRPVLDQWARAYTLSSLEVVSAVVLFGQKTPLSLIKSINPDILVKGGDYSNTKIVGQDWVEEKGGSIQIIPHLPGYSTSLTIDKIKNQSPYVF
jgi:rfaE bifunctional protein nucleotidyltransferase chain/domain